MLANFVRFVLCVLFFSVLLVQPDTAQAVEGRAYTVEIADVGKGRELAAQLETKGYRCVVPAKNIWVVDQQNNSSVWIGKNVPLEMLRVVLPEAMRFNPYLKFFYIVGDRGEKPPQAVDDTVHVGGSVEAALVKKLNVIDQKEMLAELDKASNIEELHRFLHEKNKPKPEADKPPS
jgi:hypothetical protein